MRKKEMNKITMTLNVDHLIKEALQEDISSEDVTTNAVMKEAVTGEVQLICKQDGVVAGLDVFHRVFEILDENDLLCNMDDLLIRQFQLVYHLVMFLNKLILFPLTSFYTHCYTHIYVYASQKFF